MWPWAPGNAAHARETRLGEKREPEKIESKPAGEEQDELQLVLEAGSFKLEMTF